MKYLKFIKRVCYELIEKLRTFLDFLIKKKVLLYSVCYVDDFPDSCEPGILYILGKPGNEWFAGLKCPCGCGDFIELVLDGYSPTWRLSFSAKDLPTLNPSIYRSVNCHSHFILRKGKIIWCH